MKRILILIVVILCLAGLSLFAGGVNEDTTYARTILERKDSISTYFQQVIEPFTMKNGPFHLTAVPLLGETYVLSEYPDMKNKRFSTQQMVSKLGTQTKALDRQQETSGTFLVFLTYERNEDLQGLSSFTINPGFFEYMFLDNDKGDFLRVSRDSLRSAKTVDAYNNVLEFWVTFGENEGERKKFFQDSKTVFISVTDFGFEGQIISYALPISGMFSDMPKEPKDLLTSMRSSLKVAFDGTDTPALTGQTFGSVISEPAKPSRTGYTFEGWFADKLYTKVWDFNKNVILDDTTLYAKWTVNEYSVTLDPQGGSGGTGNITVGYGAAMPSAIAPTRSGYVFTGYFDEKDGKGTAYYSDSMKSLKPLDKTEPVKLYANWVSLKSVNFDSNGGSSIDPIYNIIPGSSIAEPAIPYKEGHAFKGWYKDSGISIPWDFKRDKITSDMTFYAKWIPNTTTNGVIFRIANGAEPESLDPHQIQGVPERRIYEALFEGLVVYDPETARAVPGLAESWTVSRDGTRYTFKLREAYWSDGVKITAQQFVDSWIRILDPATAGPYAFFPCMFLKGAAEFNAGEAPASSVGVRALDESTFQMDLIGPMPYVIDALGHYSFAVVPLHAIEKYGRNWTQPKNFVGNGPFTLTEWVPQSHIRGVKNETYWDKDNVKLDEVVFYAIDDNNTAYNMYLNGEVDWTTTVPLDQLEAAKIRKDYHNYPQLSTYYYELQNERPPMDDVRVRKAFAMSVDRQVLVDKVTRGGQIPAWGIVPVMAGYPGLGEPKYDVAAAKKLLAEAGYPNGVGFPKTSIIYNTSESHKAIAQFLQQEWKKNLGVDVELENQEWATYLNNRNEGNFQIARAGWVGDYQDPNTFLDMFITGGAMNGSQFSNEVFDLLLNEAARMGGQDRMDIFFEAEYIFIDQEQAILPLYYYTTNNMIDTDKWGGWHTNTMDIHPFKNIYLK